MDKNWRFWDMFSRTSIWYDVNGKQNTLGESYIRIYSLNDDYLSSMLQQELLYNIEVRIVQIKKWNTFMIVIIH